MAAKTCIIILGMHRSGTSALTRLCSLAGATLPKNLMQSRAGNQSGHWESKPIAAFHDEMLATIDQRWDDFRPVQFTDAQRKQYRDQFCDLVQREFSDAPLIVLKEPRMSRFAELSLSAIESMGYRVCVVHALRHPLEVARSLKKRNAIPTSLGALYWLRHVVDVETSLRDRPHTILTFDQVMENGPESVRQLFSDCDLPAPPKGFETEAAKFLDPKLRHHSLANWSDAPELSVWLEPVYTALCHDAPNSPNPSSLEHIETVGAELATAGGALHELRIDLEKEQTQALRYKTKSKTLRAQIAEAKAFTDHVSLDLTQVQSELTQSQKDVSQYQLALSAERDKADKLTASLKRSRARTRAVTAQRQERDARILELETLAEFETSRAAAGADHIAAMQASTSWRITKPARELIRMWRNKTRLIVGMMAGLQARQLMQSDDLLASVNASRSPSIRDARQALQRERSSVLDGGWLKALSGDPRDDADLPPITISAVTYNSERWLPNFFKSLVALDYPAEKLSLHFVDHGSSDATLETINTFMAKRGNTYRSVQISPRDNLGYGAGNDYAIRSSMDDFVLVTNVDIEFYPSSLRRCAAVAQSDVDDVACWEFRQTPHEHPKYYDPVTMETNWNAHACVLIRRSAYLDVGGYDTRIFMYGEDVELSYRFRAKGYRLRYVPQATILHHVDLDNAALRPNQLSGSTAANILLRYRYGSSMDIAAGEALLQAVIKNEVDPARAAALDKAKQILRENRWHFWRRRVSPSLRREGKVFFPFNEFDYDIARVGADTISTPFKTSKFKSLPLVSIITRTHGPADENLRNVIACVLNQTYPNIEHIIVEDRTDDGREIVESAAARFGEDRIRYAKSPGQGRSDCGNHGASIARGKWLCWLDNDDLIFADHIETLVQALQNKPKAVASYALAWDALTETVGGDHLMHQFALPESHLRPFDRKTLMRENFIPIQSIIFQKALFDRYGGFNPDFSQLEDWNLWIRYSQVGPFVFTPKITSIYLTPHDQVERQRRHDLLHDAYDTVSQVNAKDVAHVRQRLKSASKTAPKRSRATSKVRKQKGRTNSTGTPKSRSRSGS